MSASSVTIEASFGNGTTLSALSDLIAERARRLKGETTEMAVTATAINVLSSIRARTKKAKPSDGQFGFKVMDAGDVEAGFKSERGKQRGHRVVREKGGHELTGSKVVNLVGVYTPKEVVKCFVVIFKNPRVNDKFKGGYSRVYVIAKSIGQVETWAKNKLKNYIKVYSGMAKWVIGQAQSQVSQKGFNDEISASARGTALQNLMVSTAGDGWNSGNFSVFVSDRLGYAKLALENGEADFEEALKKSANRTVGIINKLGVYSFEEDLPTPFPEVKGSK